jgi:AraC-like DNA-binding protein
VQYRNTSYEIVDGALYVIEPGEAWGCQSNDLTFQHLLVDQALLQHVAAELIESERVLPHFPRHCLFDPNLTATLHNIYARLISPVSLLQQQELLLQVLARLLISHAEYNRAPRAPGWEHAGVKLMKTYLEEHYAEDVSLDDLVRVAHMSAFHLTRVFHQTVGLPPHAYQTQIRIARARTLLAQGFPVGYVASETGFFDQAHFTHQFKRHVGVTPGTYLKSARFYKSVSFR